MRAAFESKGPQCVSQRRAINHTGNVHLLLPLSLSLMGPATACISVVSLLAGAVLLPVPLLKLWLWALAQSLQTPPVLLPLQAFKHLSTIKPLQIAVDVLDLHAHGSLQPISM